MLYRTYQPLHAVDRLSQWSFSILSVYIYRSIRRTVSSSRSVTLTHPWVFFISLKHGSEHRGSGTKNLRVDWNRGGVCPQLHIGETSQMYKDPDLLLD
ncbi:hypothetical protein TNCT_733461 [Trichonephila clavata]|uniref:Uncharacterized protein n=1 Tax=Trichonephila clavata TaxID=2740835 RepID=A0A8X6LTX6_TRICU|nr:hypothetical protein TNCT_733461 [Trichonephila clavata]